MKTQYPIIFKAFPLPALLLLADAPYFTIADVNTAYLKATGKKETDLVGKGIFEVFPGNPGNHLHANTTQNLRASLEKVLKTRRPQKMAIQHFNIGVPGTRNFKDWYAEPENVPIPDNEGNVAIIIHSLTDASEKVLQQEKQQKSEEKALIIQTGLENDKNELKKIMDSSLDVICSVDAKGNFIQVSAACEAIWGYTADELIGKPLINFVYQDDREKTNRTASNVMAGNNITNFENRYIRKDGSLVPITWSARWDKNGQIRYGVARDATEKIEVQKIIEGERQRYAELFMQVPAFICILKGPDHIFQMANPGYTQLIGKKDFIGKPVRAVFSELKGQVFFELLDTVYTSGEPFLDTEILVKTGNGAAGLPTDTYITFSYQAYRNAQNEIEGIFAFGIDVTSQVEVRRKILLNNERYEYVTKATFDAIWDWDLLSQTIYWGEGFQTIFGYNLQHVKPDISSWTDHIHPEDSDRVLKGIYEVIHGTLTNWADEYRYLKTDQTYAYVSDKGFVIRDEQGKGIRMVGAMQDITGKKELENLLDKANSLARIGSWEVDLTKNTVYWSDITKEIHEAEPDFIPDLKTDINLYKEGISRDLITQKVRDAIEKGIPYDLELQIITRRGNEKWIRAIGDSESANGKCIRIYGSFQDIDVRKRAELAVNEALDEKNTILESIDDAFFAVNKDWIVTYWNHRAEKVLGRPKNEILNHNLWQVYADSVDSASYRKYHEAIETNQAVHFEDYFEPLSKWYEISAYPSGNGLSVYFKDVTDRKLSDIRLNKLNENLQKQAKELAISNAELEQFAYVASHDLQEPLRMVTSFLTLLEKKYRDIIDESGKKYIDFAVDGAKRMRQIILDLLEFSRVGRIEDKLEVVNLNEVVEEIQILFRKQIEEKNASIVAGKLPTLNAYKAPLRQVFQNLISNALKYTRKGIPSQIQVTAKKLRNYWQFSIADNGIGIDDEYFDKIFIIFQRLHNKDDFSGTGMGLAVTKKIIENLGGKIWLESKEGKGSTFYFTLLKKH
jgi:PAS domain S-box-containing protein